MAGRPAPLPLPVARSCGSLSRMRQLRPVGNRKYFGDAPPPWLILFYPQNNNFLFYTARPMAATRQSDDPWKRHNRYRNRDRHRYRYRYRYRDRFRHDRAAGINTEASDYAQFSIAIATAIATPMPIPIPTVIPWC